MPFLWNGIYYEVVDDEKFEEGLFAQTLQEVLKGKNEGYVTFVTDRDAGFAFLAEKDCSCDDNLGSLFVEDIHIFLMVIYANNVFTEADKRKVKALNLPTELWISVLKMLPKFMDVANAAIANRTFLLIEDAPKIFWDLGLEELESQRNEFRYPGKVLGYTKSLLSMYEKFLRHPLYKAAAYVLLWKLFLLVPRDKHYADFFDLIDEVMRPFIEANIDGRKDMESYEQFKKDLVYYSNRLSLVHHVNILKSLRQTYPHKTDGWKQFGYMLLLESSKHLVNQIPYETMLAILGVYCGANGQYLLHINSIHSNQKNGASKSDAFLMDKRFEMNWNFYKGNVTDDFKIRASVVSARTAMNRLSKYCERNLKNGRKFEHAQVIGATVELLSLKTEKFKDLVDEAQLKFVFFDLETSDPIIKKFREALQEKCEGSGALRETGLEEQMIAINKIVIHEFTLSDKDAFLAVYGTPNPKNHQKVYYRQQLKAWFNKKCDFMEMTNFQDYIEILKILKNTCTKDEEFLRFVWNAFPSFVRKPSLFKNLTELFEVDELHTSLFKIGESHVMFEGGDSSRQKTKMLFNAAFREFQHIFHIKEKETNNNRRERRILLKILLILANRAYTDEDVTSINRTGIIQMMGINKLVYRLAKDDDLSAESPSRDPSFLKEWFNNRLADIPQIERQILNQNNRDFNFVFQPIRNTSKPSARSPLFYQCLLNTYQYESEYENNTSEQILKNLATVGANIDYRQDFKRDVQEAFAHSKNTIYEWCIEDLQQYQNSNLKEYVESTINFLLDKFLTHGMNKNFNCFKAIASAIAYSYKSGVDVKNELGDELIKKLDQIFKVYHQFYEENFEQEDIGIEYNCLQKLLEFPADATIPPETVSGASNESSTDDSNDEVSAN